MLDRVRLPASADRLGAFPHELSGGMRQRVMIAMALICEPALILADEPTTALDVTIAAQIVDLLDEVSRSTRTSIVLVTHDLGVVAGLCDRVVVLYGGRVVETGPTAELLARPRHPYTRGLIGATPRLDDDPDAPLAAIPGQPPAPAVHRPGCPFAPRCPLRMDRCEDEMPALVPTGAAAVACHAVAP
jgi:oligopeptide transport system ATP-binding protein